MRRFLNLSVALQRFDDTFVEGCRHDHDDRVESFVVSGVSERPFEVLSRSIAFKRRLVTVLLTVKSLHLPSTR